MMTLARLIMTLIGDRDSWDMRSMMGGMGGMGGGMGGMGGAMGGMGGGMRSVPPTGAPSTTLKPNQTRNLPTRLFSLSPPADPNASVLPAKGEKLRISDITRKTSDPRIQAALKRLSEDKAPETVATLVMWNVSGGMTWDQEADASKGWANEHELTLAKSFVAKLDSLPKEESGVLFYEVEGSSPAGTALAAELSTLLKDIPVLGLKVRKGVPARPDAPSVACRIVVSGTEATVNVTTSDSSASAWHPEGKFTLPVTLENGKPQAAKFADAMAEGLLGRLVRAQLSRTGQMVKGKALYKIRIDNASPLIVNGVAILGEGTSNAEKTPKVFSALSVSPRKSMTLLATSDIVDQLGLRKGVRVIAADLSGL
jgi:hypothetical protein